jgi:integrase
VEGHGRPWLSGRAVFARLLLLTGQRLREVAEMAWPEIELDKALWTIPADRMKADSAHEVPLAPQSIAILESLPHWPGPYIFSTTGGERPISGFSKMKLRIDAALAEAIPAWRFHDLRRTMRTGLGGLPVPPNVAEMCLAHAQPGLHQVYDRHSYRDEKRRAFELWAARLKEIVEPGGQGNVHSFK